MSGSTPFVFEADGGAKRYAPATERNRDAIGDILQGILPPAGMVLEIASGTGEHATYFARRFPDLLWQPSDPDSAGRESIAAWRAEAGGSNLLPPIEIDAAGEWRVDHADAMLCINMVHISVWEATLGLFRNAAAILPRGAPLYLYGPYLQHDVPTAHSNAEFDVSLRSRNPDWGLRHVEDVTAVAEAHGMKLASIVEMPANNLSLIFRR